MAPRSIPFVKAHGLGNDFLLVAAEDMGHAPPGEMAVRICDRHTGVGADGLVILGASASATSTFRIYNADGSEAGLSGNALRCSAAWLVQQQRAEREVTLDTKVGLRRLHFLGRAGGEWSFRAEIGTPLFTAADVPFCPPYPPGEPIIAYPLPVRNTRMEATLLSMGNPQCILIVDNWESLDWLALGAELERHPYFPDRANIGFVRVLSADCIEARFWERGAGHTLASGTGSCACAVAAALAGKTKRSVSVQLERGAMRVDWREDGVVELTGPAVIVAAGSFHR